MRSRSRLSLLAVAGGLVFAGYALSAEPRGDAPEAASKAKGDDLRVTVEIARDRAKLMHNVYAATLDTLHHHYFRKGRMILPARAMEDIFAEIDDQTKIKARWIAVNTRAMGIDHVPQTDFDRKAVVELTAGKGAYELVEKGVYYRAGAIPLGPGCVGCHASGSSSAPSQTPRFAGLVISVPLSEN